MFKYNLKKYKPFISVVLVVLALIFLVFYLKHNHQLVTELANTPIRIIASLFVLNILMFYIICLTLKFSVNLCSKDIEMKENATLSTNSLLINFFIPGQGGPIYRALALKKSKHIKIRQFIFTCIVYYAFYGVISLFMFFLGSFHIWITFGITLLASITTYLIVSFYKNNHKLSGFELNSKYILIILIVTALQCLTQIAIYSVELHYVNPGIHLHQIITYTGAANLALFVSLTPGAIGIRESFLILSEKLHHISSHNIIVASVIDRSVYILFLVCLSLIVLGRLLISNNKNLSLNLIKTTKANNLIK